MEQGEEQEDKGADSADNTASSDSNMTDSRITDSSITDSMTTESSQASTDAGEGSAAPNPADSTSIMQGYVMVPILTPYYDPSGEYERRVGFAGSQVCGTEFLAGNCSGTGARYFDAVVALCINARTLTSKHMHASTHT